MSSPIFSSSTEIVRHKPTETVVLRDAEKKNIDYSDTEETDGIRLQLSWYNEFVDQNSVDLFLPNEVFDGYTLNEDVTEYSDLSAEDRRVDLSHRYSRRIFNNSSFVQGGRIYGGWWQTVPSRLRRFITINGYPTVEIDYSGMQLSMLYALCGQPMVGDAYCIEGIDSSYRKVLKKAVLQLINSSEGQRIRHPLPSDLPDGWNFEDVQEAIRERHAPIQRFFRSGEGIYLQRVDSDIAMKVVIALGRMGQLALPVHDSFLVVGGFKQQLRVAMLEAYRDAMGTSVEVAADPSLIDFLTEPEDDPALEMDVFGEPQSFTRMYNMCRSEGYSRYRTRLLQFVDSQTEDWKWRHHGAPTWG